VKENSLRHVIKWLIFKKDIIIHTSKINIYNHNSLEINTRNSENVSRIMKKNSKQWNSTTLFTVVGCCPFRMDTVSEIYVNQKMCQLNIYQSIRMKIYVKKQWTRLINTSFILKEKTFQKKKKKINYSC